MCHPAMKQWSIQSQPPPPPPAWEKWNIIYIYVYIPLYWDTKILKHCRCIWESSKSSTGFYSLNLSDHSIGPPHPSTHPSSTYINEAGNARYLMPFHTNIGLDLTLICCYWCCYYVCTQYIIPPRRSHQWNRYDNVGMKSKNLLMALLQINPPCHFCLTENAKPVTQIRGNNLYIQ